MKNIHVYVAKEGYAARVKDTRSYNSVRYNLFIHSTPSWPPLPHPYPEIDSGFIAKIFCRDGHFRWYPMTTIPVGMCMSNYVVINIFPRIIQSPSHGV